MKKNLLSVFGLIMAGSLSATQYMHINQPDGKEYDVKIEKTDRVSHVKGEDGVFIKVTKTDNSYSLYPLAGSEVTFDESIASVDTNVLNWHVVDAMLGGCVYDTTKAHEMRAYSTPGEVKSELNAAKSKYEQCVDKVKSENIVAYNGSEVATLRSANQFATNLFINLAQDDDYKNMNLVFSPTSFQFAMAMLTNGADDDEVYAELTSALGNENMPLDTLNTLYQKRLTLLKTLVPERVNVGVANAVFLQEGNMFGKNFLQNLNTYYYAATNNVDFNEDTTYTIMDKWASRSTNGMIKKIGIEKSVDLLLVLTNAISFQSPWQNTFGSAKEGQFIKSDGTEVTVDKMTKMFEGNYVEGVNYQLVTSPFLEGYEMNVVLPKEGYAPLEVLSSINFDQIEYKTDKDSVYRVELYLPKFDVDSKLGMRKVMENTHFKNCFKRFYNYISTIPYPMAILSDVRQLTHLEIDEEGAKAAAVTALSLTKEFISPGPVKYKDVVVDVNRPFIVTINNPRNHELLFVGVINNPAE